MDTKSLPLIISQFAARFCNELEKNKSVVCSPLSAELVLALLTLGATEPAHSQLLTALGVADDHAIRSKYAGMVSHLKCIKSVTLNVANKVYIKEGSYDLQPQLKEDAVNIFDAEIEKVDFNDSAAAVNNINTWVEGKTNNNIKNILSEDSFDSETALVLVNAIYFKGSWKHQFLPHHTRERTFHLNAHSTVQVPMMTKDHRYSYDYSEHLQAKLLELPYLGEQTSMVIVLPKEIEGINNVLAKLAAGYDLMAEIETMRVSRVQVTIPKFKIETEIDMKELLPKLGVKAIFDPSNSGLTKILNCNDPLYVSSAIQKAVIEVNEEGTKAAAASVSRVRLCCSPPTFTADHPFLYMLLDADRVPLFIGVYCGDNDVSINHENAKRRKLDE